MLGPVEEASSFCQACVLAQEAVLKLVDIHGLTPKQSCALDLFNRYHVHAVVGHAKVGIRHNAYILGVSQQIKGLHLLVGKQPHGQYPTTHDGEVDLSKGLIPKDLCVLFIGVVADS